MNEREIGEAIKHWRLEAGIDQAELARRPGTSQRTISHLENGKSVTIAHINDLLRALGKSWGDPGTGHNRCIARDRPSCLTRV